MSDKLFRWLIIANLTVAVVGALILGAIHVTGQQRMGSIAEPLRVQILMDANWPDMALKGNLRDISLALQNQGNSLREIGLSLAGPDPSTGRRHDLSEALRQFAQAQTELATTQRQAAENGRYQQLQSQMVNGAVQFFDTRTGEPKAAN